jgi:hypothetical protein
MLFDMFYHFLLNAADDGSAYMRSHTWRDRRNLSKFESEVDQKIEVGSFVLNYASNSDGKNLKGFVGKVIATGESNTIVEWRREMGGHEGQGRGGKNGHCWNVPKAHLLVISEELYSKQETYSLSGESASEEMLDTLDELPDGTTPKQMEAIIKKNYKKIIMSRFQGLS